MNRCLLLLLSLIALSATAQDTRGITPAKASEVTTRGQTYAIIVGISKYKQVAQLKYADRDAQAFDDFLMSEAGGKVPRANVETFLNERATRSNVGDAISMVARKAKPGDLIYFFFAGHGDMEDLSQIDNGLLLLYNSPNGNYFGMTDDVLQILNLKLYLSPLTQKGIDMMFIIDACHAGNLAGGVQGAKLTTTALATSWGKEYKILSCQPNQLSEESKDYGGGRGLFSWCFEEGIKGLADEDSSGAVSMYELEKYLKDNVRKYSEKRQIPMITGDLERSFFTVNPNTVAMLKKLKQQNYPMLASVDNKRGRSISPDSLNPAARAVYDAFQRHLEARALVWPLDTNALRDLRIFQQIEPGNDLAIDMRRALAAALNERFNNIVAPQLKGETSYSTKDECYYAAMELDSCLQLLGSEHYMYPNLKARKLYMDAMALTWALSETDYNMASMATVQESLRLLEESERLEPNAAYTLSALGTRYYMLSNFDRAFSSFNKYISLRPSDFFAKYSLMLLYMKLKAYDKALPIAQQLLKDHPDYGFMYSFIFECQYYTGQKKAALASAWELSRADSLDKHFTVGIYYALEGRVDSSVYYYQMAAAGTPNCGSCYNNIGHAYFMAGKMDSARSNFNRSIREDSTYAGFPLFNLASIDVIEGYYTSAIQGFLSSFDKTPSMKEAFFSHFDMYFNKKWIVRDSVSFKEFQKKSLKLELQYMDVLSIFYAVIRDSAHTYKEGALDTLFNRMLLHKTHEAFSWYHYACLKSLQHDKAAALESLEKALRLGFGYSGMMAADADLEFIRNEPEYKALVKKYFPAGLKKTRR